MKVRLSLPLLLAVAVAVAVAVCHTAPVHGAETQTESEADLVVGDLRAELDNFCRAACAIKDMQSARVLSPDSTPHIALVSMRFPSADSGLVMEEAARWLAVAGQLRPATDHTRCVHDCRVFNVYSLVADEAPPAVRKPIGGKGLGGRGMSAAARAKMARKAPAHLRGVAKKPRTRTVNVGVNRGNTKLVRVTDVNGRPVSPRTASVVKNIVSYAARQPAGGRQLVNINQPLRGPTPRVAKVTRQRQLESDSDSNSRFGAAPLPRFSSVLSRLHVQHQLNQQSMAIAEAHTPAPGFVYVWHFTTAATGAAIDTRYKVGMTRFQRKCKSNRYQWQARVAESIKQTVMTGLGYSYVIDRIYAFNVDALGAEKIVHARLLADGFPRWVTGAAPAAVLLEKARRVSGLTEVFELTPPPMGNFPAANYPPFPAQPPTPNALVYLDNLIQTASAAPNAAVNVCGMAGAAACQTTIAPAIGCPPIAMCPKGC